MSKLHNWAYNWLCEAYWNWISDRAWLKEELNKHDGIGGA